MILADRLSMEIIPLTAIDPILTLPEQWWFQFGCITVGVWFGLLSAATVVESLDRTREGSETVETPKEFMQLILFFLRQLSIETGFIDPNGSHSSQLPNWLTTIMILPSIPALLAFIRGILWTVNHWPSSLSGKFTFLYGVVYALLPFAIASIGFFVPVCVGVWVYVAPVNLGLDCLRCGVGLHPPAR